MKASNEPRGAAASSCRRCGACCIAPSISSPLPGMAYGKPAGVRCVNLRADNTCGVYAERPPVCSDFTPAAEICGHGFDDAMHLLGLLEEETSRP